MIILEITNIKKEIKMKKLELFHYIVEEISKSKGEYPNIFIGKINDEFDYISDEITIRIIRSDENPFKYRFGSSRSYNKKIKELSSLKAEKVTQIITMQDKELFGCVEFSRGIFKGEEVYFNPNLLRYFDENCELYKNHGTDFIGVKENNKLVGMIMSWTLFPWIKEKINKKLGS